MGRFTVHGSMELHIENRILYVEGAGPWNLEALMEAEKKYAPLIKQLSGEPWGTMAVMLGEPIFVPEAAEHMIRLIKEDRKNGCVASAILVDNSNSPEFAKRHIAELHGKAKSQFRFFSDQAEASWWLVQQITSSEVK